MSRRLSFNSEEYYHLYGRGVEKREIFLDKGDYQRFVSLLFICNDKTPVHLSNLKSITFKNLFLKPRENVLIDIGLYCLMPNHFHILVREKDTPAISSFMQKVLTAYTMYFNKKYNRSGTLFESKFRAEHVAEDRYLKYLFSYIHLNPLKLHDKNWKESGVKNLELSKKFLVNYAYSSYLDYLQIERAQKSILNLASFPEYFLNKEAVEKEIFDWILFSKP